jgi:hypothetical protein
MTPETSITAIESEPKELELDSPVADFTMLVTIHTTAMKITPRMAAKMLAQNHPERRGGGGVT